MARRKRRPVVDSRLHGSGTTASPWMGPGVFEAAPLEERLEADVCVLGAGVSGLTAAYRLAEDGLSVVVLEAGDLSSGETARSTAHLSTALGTRYYELEELRGFPEARLVAESHAAAIDYIEGVVRENDLDCGFRRLNGYLFWPADGNLRELQDERDACQRAGLPVETVESAPPAFWNSGPCLKFAGQADLDPLRYLSGLARAARRHGVRIFTRSRGEILDGTTLRVAAGRGLVTCRAAVVATNAPVDDLVAIAARQAAYRTYALAAELPPGALAEPLLLWDTLEPYHYVRLAGSELLVGGEDHKVGHAADAEERWRRLEGWARARFPMLGRVTRRWSGQVQETPDGLAYAGRHPTEERDVFVITGDCGNGMTHGTLGGLLVADLFAGRANPWADVYDPSRLVAGSVPDLARENLDAAAQYLRYALKTDADSVDQIPPGAGAVVRREGKPVAVYRAPDGSVVERSAICPHLGGMVCWNAGEGTWDCPVHGSRFAPSGEPVTGPANEALGTPENPLPGNPIIGPWLSSPPPSP